MMGRTFGKRSAIRAATAAIFIWRTLPAPRRWARRIWAQLTRHKKRYDLMPVAPYHKLILSYPDFSLAIHALQWLTSKLCLTSDSWQIEAWHLYMQNQKIDNLKI